MNKKLILVWIWKLSYLDYSGFDIHRWHCCWFYIFADPEHQRAKGNLKYFEFQLEKQKKAAADEAPKEKEQKKRDTTEKKKKSKKKPTFQLMPERKKYEMLCRGEGVKMVRHIQKNTISNNKPKPKLWTCVSCLYFSFNQTPRRQSRLFCRYYDNNHNPKYVLSPVKQQDEWDRPYIVRYLNIISDKEIDTIKQLAKPRVSYSQ